MKDLIENIEFHLSHSALKKTEEYLNHFPSNEDSIKDIFDFLFLKQFLENEFQEIIIRGESLLMKSRDQNLSYELALSQKLVTLSFKVLNYLNQQTWNAANPFISFVGRIRGKLYRLSMLHKSCGNNDHHFFIRSIKESIFDIESFTPTPSLINELFSTKQNIIVAGASGSGKTSLINSLLKSIAPQENLVVIEDIKEIITHHPHTTRMTHRDAEVLKNFCSYSVRMNPDRIIIGEIRSKEVLPFLLAINSGVRGVLTSIHANSAVDAIYRLAQLFDLFSGNSQITYEQTLRFITKSVDYICYMAKGQIIEIIKVINFHSGQVIYDEVSLH